MPVQFRSSSTGFSLGRNQFELPTDSGGRWFQSTGKKRPPCLLCRRKRRRNQIGCPEVNLFLCRRKKKGGIPFLRRRPVFLPFQPAFVGAGSAARSRTINPSIPSSRPFPLPVPLTDTSGTIRTFRSPTTCIICSIV